ncbi:MAG: hypothetical protein WCP57_06970 [Bacteroidota bacterium]
MKKNILLFSVLFSIQFSSSGAANLLMLRINNGFVAYKKNSTNNYLQLLVNDFQIRPIVVFEKSYNGEDFNLLPEIKDATSNRTIKIDDQFPFIRNNYYRLKRIKNNSIIYKSSIAYIFSDLHWTNDDILVYPYPISEQQKINIIFPRREELLEIELFDLNGKKTNQYQLSTKNTINSCIELYYPIVANSSMIIIKIKNSIGDQFTKKVFLNSL